MTPHKQLFRHDPDNGVWGDCGRTVIACLLDMKPEDVPHFWSGERTATEGTTMCMQWLAEHGYSRFSIAFQCTLPEVFEVMSVTNPGIYYMLVGQSRTGCNHVVIALGSEIVHDPSLTDSGIIGPCDDGYIWVEVLTPHFKPASD